MLQIQIHVCVFEVYIGRMVSFLFEGECGGLVVVSDSGARGRGFDTYLCHVVSLSKDTFTP